MASLQRLYLSFSLLITLFSASAQINNTIEAKREKYITKEYWHTFGYNSPQWQMYLDSALVIEPRNSRLWQQKSMPNMKNGNYYEGMRFLNKAVEYDTLAWLGYRGFMKCVFMKDYTNAIIDLKSMYNKRPIEQVMDHSYPFWIGISYLKLNQLEDANRYLSLSVDQGMKNGKEWVHYVDWFYWGIVKYKQKDYEKALEFLENATSRNSHFPDAEFYKAMILLQKNKKEEAKTLLLQAKANIATGYRMNEDNEFYVNYPYQITVNEIDEYLQKLQ